MFEGRVGRVNFVLQGMGSESPELKLKLVFGKGLRNTITVDANDVEPEGIDWLDPAPTKMDWRTVNTARRVELANQTAIRESELVQDGTMLECGTVGAMLAEGEVRIQGVEGVCIAPRRSPSSWRGRTTASRRASNVSI